MALKSQRPQVWVTAYDFFQAQLAQAALLDAILVGDSLGMTMLGYDSTLAVTMDDMVYHARVVRRGAPQTVMVVDLPFLSYRNQENALTNAGRLIQETLADAVKLEGGRRLAETVRALVLEGIPVVGHLGLTPQSVHTMGGYKVQARTTEGIVELLDDAESLAQAGITALVLEGIPDRVAALVTERIHAPTIGIGAGQGTDGQVLVFHDCLGLSAHTPKFVAPFSEGRRLLMEGLQKYRSAVLEHQFPDDDHAYHITSREWERFMQSQRDPSPVANG